MSRCWEVGVISVDRASDLRHTRTKINKLAEDVTNGNTEADANKPRLGREWAFVDLVTTNNCFRIERESENKYFLVDICSSVVVVVDNSRGHPGPAEGLDNAGLGTAGGEPRPPGYHIPLPVYQNTAGLLEKNTEAVLRAARLGDMEMLADLHQDGFSLLAIDETAKTALHYGARFGNKEVVRFLLQHAPSSIIGSVT